MNQLDVKVCGRNYRIACGPGQEDRVQALAARINAEAVRLSGPGPLPAAREAKAILIAALLIADKLDEAEHALTGGRAHPVAARAAAPPPAPRRPAARGSDVDVEAATQVARLKAERDEIAAACAQLLNDAADQMDRISLKLEEA